ncbi:MAG: hypothetical protein R2909_15525 [Gemmatimonadales bacterium]
MFSRVKPAALAALALTAACQGERVGPVEEAAPSFVISDGANNAGNPEFFFLPPLVKRGQDSPNWTPGGFNGNLRPSLAICALDLPASAPESAVLPSTPCRAGGYLATYPFGTDGPTVRLHGPGGGDPDDGAGDGDGGHYHANWKVPNTSDVFFRIRVLVGTVQLGFADLHSVESGKDLKNVNTGEFIARKDGTVAPIKFRIERRALCDDPAGTAPCVSADIDLGEGGTVSLVTDPLQAPSGVAVPPQPQSQTVTVTVQTCADFNPRVIDLPTFGTCLRITVQPALQAPLVDPATVFVCDYPPDVSSLTHAQRHRVTLHRLKSTGVVEALPHADHACIAPSASTGDRLRGMIRYLAERRWEMAGEQALDLLGPARLHALDRGGGGLTFGFSDFQFALPGRLEIVSGDGQIWTGGATLPSNPTVRVTDVGGDPVAGATVSFAASAGGSVGTPSAVTNAGGLASTTWTIASGLNQLAASGRGIAGTLLNGPRSGVDPFMAIQAPFDPPVANPQPVDLATGSVQFGATGLTPATLPIGPFSPDWFYQVVPQGANPGFPAGGLTGLALGGAGFGTANSGCSLNGEGVNTAWPTDSDILAKKYFTVPTTTTVRIAIAVDNDVRVFLDGVEITSTAIGEHDFLDGYLRHEGCPSYDSFVFRLTVGAGVHELALRGRDRGSQAFLDATVSVAPTEP